jgi:hypothetical protein
MEMVTPVPGPNECVEIDRTALGRNNSWPMRRQLCVYPLLAMAFIGLP